MFLLVVSNIEPRPITHQQLKAFSMSPRIEPAESQASEMAQVWRAFIESPGYYNHSPWFPNPLICMRDMAARATVELVDRLPWNGVGVWLEESRQVVETTAFLDSYFIPLAITLAFLFTVVRALLDSALLKVSTCKL